MVLHHKQSMDMFMTALPGKCKAGAVFTTKQNKDTEIWWGMSSPRLHRYNDG